MGGGGGGNFIIVSKYVPGFCFANLLIGYTKLYKVYSTRKYFVGFKGNYDQKQNMSFATVLCLILENVYGRL